MIAVIQTEIDRLITFCHVVRLGSFTKAAEELFLTQPAVSVQISKLERSLRVRLVEQRGQRIYPTDAGKRLYAYAEQVQQLCRVLIDATRAVADDEGELQGRIALGATTTIALYMLPSLLRQFQQQHGGVEIALTVTTTKSIVESLPADHHDFCLIEGVVGSSLRAPGIRYEPFFKDELSLIVHSGHPWAERSRTGIALDELSREVFIGHRPGSTMQVIIERVLRRHGVKVNQKMAIDNMEVVKRMVEAGLGVSIVSQVVLDKEVTAGELVIVPIKGVSFSRTFHIGTLNGRILSRAALTFLDYFRNAVAAKYCSPQTGQSAESAAVCSVDGRDQMGEKQAPCKGGWSIAAMPGGRGGRRPR